MAQRTCSVEGCERPAVTRGWCKSHYNSWNLRGVTHGRTAPPPTKKDPVVRFWAKVNKTETCWLWTAATGGDGHAVFYDGMRVRSAAQFLYELEVGPVGDGNQLVRTCDVTSCVRPDHMQPVSRAEFLNLKRLERVKSECPKGHEYTPANTFYAGGGRRCLACDRARTKVRYRNVRMTDEAHDRIYVEDVMERDGNRCALCEGLIDQSLRFPHPMSRSVDHIVPLSVGGTHTFDNVQAAHLGCNTSKGAKTA